MAAEVSLPARERGGHYHPALAGRRPIRRPLPPGDAAAHVAARSGGVIDWDATYGFREHLWTHGFGIDGKEWTPRSGGMGCPGRWQPS